MKIAPKQNHSKAQQSFLEKLKLPKRQTLKKKRKLYRLFSTYKAVFCAFNRKKKESSHDIAFFC
jgi:hypothetical protein